MVRHASRLPLSTVWWLHPGRVMAFLVLPFYLTFPVFDFARADVPAYLPGFDYVWGAFLMIAFALAATFTARDPSRGHVAPTPREVHIPAWVFALLLALTVMAYVVWFYPIVAQPAILAGMLQGDLSLRGILTTRPGITTLTQCGVAYVVACAIHPGVSRTPLRRWQTLGVVVVLMLALFRVFAWSERLAMIEIGVTGAVAFAAFARPHPRWRGTIAWLPLLVPFAVYLLFTGTEYFRSWEFYRDKYASIWAFSFDRLLTYYATASNNGIGLLVESHDWPAYTGRFVFEWLYVAPGAGTWLQDNVGDVGRALTGFLEHVAREEFNNPSGLFPIVYDIGYFGSAVYFLVVGGLVGFAYRRYAQGRLFGLLAYPSCYLFVLELLRFNYFAASRLVPIVGSLVLIAWSPRLTSWLARARRPTPARIEPSLGA